MSEFDKIKQPLSNMSEFIETRYDPLKQSVQIVEDEQKRLTDTVHNILESQKKQNRSAILASSARNSDAPRVPSGKYRGCDAFDLMVARTLFTQTNAIAADKVNKVDFDVDPRMLEGWEQNLTGAQRALDDVTPGAGDEFLYTGEASEMWRNVHLQTSVASLFNMMMMPTNPFQYPFDFGDIAWYRGAANIASTSTNPLTGRRTLTAIELVGAVAFSYNLEEDSVVAILPELRALITRNAAEVLDDIVINGDESDDGSNINADGAAAGDLANTAFMDHFLIFDGLLHIPFVDNTSQRVNHQGAAVSHGLYNSVRAKLGRFGVKPSDIAFVVDINTYIKSNTMENFTTLEKFGPQATILTGQLGAVEGVPVIVSEQMLMADTDGKVTDAGNGTDTGRLMCVNKSQYRIGYRREMMLESERDIQKRQTVLVPSMRVAFDGRNDNGTDIAVAAGYNISA